MTFGSSKSQGVSFPQIRLPKMGEERFRQGPKGPQTSRSEATVTVKAGRIEIPLAGESFVGGEGGNDGVVVSPLRPLSEFPGAGGGLKVGEAHGEGGGSSSADPQRPRPRDGASGRTYAEGSADGDTHLGTPPHCDPNLILPSPRLERDPGRSGLAGTCLVWEAAGVLLMERLGRRRRRRE